MNQSFSFQVEESAPIGHGALQVEGRCCEGTIQEGDRFTELVVRTKKQDGSFNLDETRAVSILVHEVTSIRPGFLGFGETGTLKVRGVEAAGLGRDCLLRGHRS